MRLIIRALMILLAATLLAACSQEAQAPPDAESLKPAVVEPQPVTEQTKQAVAEVKQQVKQAVAEIKEEAGKQAEAVKQEASKQVEAVKQEASRQVAAVKVEASAAIEQTKTGTISVVDKVKTGTVSALAGLTAKAPMTAAVKGPEEVVYAASMGRVTFNHAGHSDRQDCSKCHTTDPPQLILMTKEVAHSLCKGCHKTSGGNAPTACAGCHEK